MRVLLGLSVLYAFISGVGRTLPDIISDKECKRISLMKSGEVQFILLVSMTIFKEETSGFYEFKRKERKQKTEEGPRILLSSYRSSLV